jgi:general secretion pathway protein G
MLLPYSVSDARRSRLAVIWAAALFLLLTVALLWVAIAPPIRDTKEMFVQYGIRGIRSILLSSNKRNGYYPITEQGLNALVPKLMEELPKDAWGSPYVYRYPGKRYPNAYDLFSAGPDRIADTADDEWGK